MPTEPDPRADGNAGEKPVEVGPHAKGAEPRFGWIPGLLQVTDSIYPTGGYAHSFGLEGLVQEGALRDPSTLRLFMIDQALQSLVRIDLQLAAQAWSAAEPADWSRLRELCLLASAARGSREPRDASESVGSQRVELAARLRGGLAAEFYRRAASGGWPIPACVAAAIEGRALGAPREAVLGAVLYSAMSGLVASAMKLLRFGQIAGQTLLTEVLHVGSSAIAAMPDLPPDEIGSFNPWWDIAASRHESAEFRLFIS